MLTGKGGFEQKEMPSISKRYLRDRSKKISRKGGGGTSI